MQQCNIIIVIATNVFYHHMTSNPNTIFTRQWLKRNQHRDNTMLQLILYKRLWKIYWVELKSFLNNHFVWMLSFVDTCLRFIANVIYFIDWHFYSRIMHLFPIVTIDKPALYLMEHNCKFVPGIASQQRVIVFINLTVWSLLITLSESTSQPIPKSRSKALVSQRIIFDHVSKNALVFCISQ